MQMTSVLVMQTDDLEYSFYKNLLKFNISAKNISVMLKEDFWICKSFLQADINDVQNIYNNLQGTSQPS